VPDQVEPRQAGGAGGGEDLPGQLVEVEQVSRCRSGARAGQVRREDRVPLARRLDEGSPVRRCVGASAVDQDQSWAAAGSDVVEQDRSLEVFRRTNENDDASTDRLAREVETDGVSTSLGERRRLGTQVTLQEQDVTSGQVPKINPFEVSEPGLRVLRPDAIEVAGDVHRGPCIPVGLGRAHHAVGGLIETPHHGPIKPEPDQEVESRRR